MTAFEVARLPATGMFLAFVAMTLVITAWAARRAGSREGFYTADGSVTGLQNGLAFAGDFMSASTFLGITGMYFIAGFDGFVYCIGSVAAFSVLLFMVSEKMRRLGRFTLTDVLVHRLSAVPMRIFSGIATLLILIVYMVAQLVGAGVLIALLLGIEFAAASAMVGSLMLVYVVFGGMVATTWVQIIKAVLLLGVGVLMTILVLAQFEFSLETLFAAAVSAHPAGTKIMGPSSLISGPGAAVSLGLTLVFGPAGLPHILMRFFTVPSVAEARRSASYATLFIGAFFLMTIVIGYGTIALVMPDPAYVEGGQLRGGSNVAALALAHALGGDLFLGFACAVAFATILAVVAGLTLAAAAGVSHDLYSAALRRHRASEQDELRVSRIAALAFGAVGIGLSIVFQSENITTLVVISFSIAASATFPVLALCLYWGGLTTAGALAGGLTGLTAAIVLTILSPTVWVAVLGFAAPLFPYQYPTIVSMPLAFAAAILVSMAPVRAAEPS